jgi:hypothetical protein
MLFPCWWFWCVEEACCGVEGRSSGGTWWRTDLGRMDGLMLTVCCCGEVGLACMWLLSLSRRVEVGVMLSPWL